MCAVTVVINVVYHHNKANRMKKHQQAEINHTKQKTNSAWGTECSKKLEI